MATVDYSPLFNSLRNAGTNMANMALKSTLMDAEVAKAGLARDQMLANTALANSKTRLNDMKYDAVTPVIAALKGLDLNDVNVRNELVTAANGKPYLPYTNVGNTGATYNGADGSVVGDVATNPLLRSTIDLNQAKTRAQMALAGLSDTKAQAGGFAPRSGTVGGTRAAGGNNGNTIPRMYSSQELMDDGTGVKRLVTKVDYDALRDANAAIVAAGGNPNDIRAHIAYINGELKPQGQVPTVDMRPDSPTAGQVVQSSAQVPQDLVNLPADQQILEMFRRGLITKGQAAAMAAQAGIQ